MNCNFTSTQSASSGHAFDTSSSVTKALIGGGGWGGGCICICLCSCSARIISFQMNLKTTDFKRHSSGGTRIYEYIPPALINALVMHLGTSNYFCYIGSERKIKSSIQAIVTKMLDAKYNIPKWWWKIQ